MADGAQCCGGMVLQGHGVVGEHGVDSAWGGADMVWRVHGVVGAYTQEALCSTGVVFNRRCVPRHSAPRAYARGACTRGITDRNQEATQMKTPLAPCPYLPCAAGGGGGSAPAFFKMVVPPSDGTPPPPARVGGWFWLYSYGCLLWHRKIFP